MEYDEELRQIISTFTAGLTQLENYLRNKNLEYNNRLSVVESEVHQNNKTKSKILAVLQEDLNGN